MAQSRVFTLIGDSNVRRHMNDSNCLDRPLMSGAETITCTRLALFPQSLLAIRSSSNVCVVSCVTNFLSDSPEENGSMPGQRVEPVLTEFFRLLVDSCKTFPDRKYLTCPPMFRRSPTWFREGLPEIMTSFSAAFVKNSVGIPNLFAMPGFATPSFESDGIHLTAYSGYQYVLHLFSRAQALLDAVAASPDVQAPATASSEEVRSLQDRMMATEQDLRRLNTEFELKTAIDSELACFRSNERNEDSFIISGLGKIRSGLSGRDWQSAAKESILKVVQPLSSSPFRIVVVHNITGRSTDAAVTYSVRLDSIEASREIRSKFSSFFKGGVDSRPDALASISIRNVVTKETRIRISILKMLGQNYQNSNPGAKFQVIGYEPRPTLKLTPPPGSNSRIKVFTFVEAVRKLPSVFPEAELSKVTRQASSQFPGRLRSLFVVLSDDKARTGQSSRNKRSAEPSDQEPPSQRIATD